MGDGREYLSDAVPVPQGVIAPPQIGMLARSRRSWITASGVSCDKLISLLADPQIGLHRPLTHRYAERIVHGDYKGGMPLDAARKDSVLALELAQKLRVPLFAIQGAHSVYDMAVAAGDGREDYASVAKLWTAWGCPCVPARDYQDP